MFWHQEIKGNVGTSLLHNPTAVKQLVPLSSSQQAHKRSLTINAHIQALSSSLKILVCYYLLISHCRVQDTHNTKALSHCRNKPVIMLDIYFRSDCQSSALFFFQVYVNMPICSWSLILPPAVEFC